MLMLSRFWVEAGVLLVHSQHRSSALEGPCLEHCVQLWVLVQEGAVGARPEEALS